MSGSLYAAVSGLNANQQMLGVVSQNVANVNTVGYKSSAISFAEAMQQTQAGAGAPTANQGGTNPIQYTAGGAVNVSGVQVNMSQGQIQSTGVNTNMAIQGSGFFVVQLPQGGRAYTRAGNFTLDGNGNLVDPFGDRVLGWMANSQGVLPAQTKGNLVPVQVPQTPMPPTTSSNITLSGNLDSADAGQTDAAGNPTVEQVPVTVYDSLGAAIPVTLDFQVPATGSTSWTLTGYNVNGGTTQALSGTLTFDAATGQVSSAPSGLSLSVANPTDGTTTNITLDTADFQQLTSYASATTVQATSNGAAAGTLQSFNINDNGVVVGTYSNGLTQNIGAVSLASFSNPNGLTNIGNNLWQTSPNSGASLVGPANAGNNGSILSGSVEGSNVNLANEFVNMIIAQQGYQANAKIITVDQALRSTLTNMVQ